MNLADRVPARLRLPLLALAMLALVPVAVLPQLSARVTGREYLLRVAPVDPIDPFRGAYVALSYPDLAHGASMSSGGGMGSMEDGERGQVFVTLVPDGELYRAGSWTRQRPSEGPYLSCDDRQWQIRCGIESWFVPQDRAAELARAVTEDHAVARVRVDSRGHASIVGLEVEGVAG